MAGLTGPEIRGNQQEAMTVVGPEPFGSIDDVEAAPVLDVETLVLTPLPFQVDMFRMIDHD